MKFNARRARTARTFPKRIGGMGNIFTDAYDWLRMQTSDAIESGANATAAAIDDLKKKITQFGAAYNDMLASRNDAYAVGMGSDYDAIKQIMDATKATVDGAVSAWQMTSNFASNMATANVDFYGDPATAGMYGLGRVRRLRGLGIVPIIAAAAVAGVVAAIIYALSKYSDYQEKLLAMKRQLIAEGKLDPSSLDAPSFMGETASLIKWGLIGAAALVLWPYIKPQLDKLGKRL